jgi:hypothetical protein
MQFKIKNILPNPFRHIENYPIKPEKVDALRKSIQTTEFWCNMIGRPVGKNQVEIPYGHHRRVALQLEYGDDHLVDIHVQAIPDDRMLQIMANENMEDWGTSAIVEIETIAAVVEAYAEGKITLHKPAKNSPELRNAPSYIMRTSYAAYELPYTIQTIGEFLGWVYSDGRAQRKISYCLDALELIEQGEVTAKDFTGLKTTELEAVVGELRKVWKEREASARAAEERAKQAEIEANQATDSQSRSLALQRYRHETKTAAKHRETAKKEGGAVTRHLTAQLRSGQIGRGGVKEEAEKVRNRQAAKPKKDINDAVYSFTTQTIDKMLATDQPAEKITELIRFNSELTIGSKRLLRDSLKKLSERALSFSKCFPDTELNDAKAQPYQLTNNGK